MIQLPINLLIADDHQIITDGISKILEEEKMIGVIYTAKNGKEAVEVTLANNIDCVIMDINMPVLNGHEATKIIKKEKPFVKVIVVSMLSDAAIVSKLLKAGADAFVNKDTGKKELLKAIGSVINGENYISPEISLNLFNHLSVKNTDSGEDDKHLTGRELEIVRYIAEGHTNTEIAAMLFLSKATIDTHRKNVLAKLKIHNTAALIKFAVDHKLI